MTTIENKLKPTEKRVWPWYFKWLGPAWMLVTRGDWFHFKSIYLETSTACNRRCSYCPVSIAPEKQLLIADADLKIALERIRAHRWLGPVVLSRFNESLLDGRIVELVRRVRRVTRFPMLFSNGDKLTMELAGRLVEAGLWKCRITRHPPTTAEWGTRVGEVVTAFPRHFRMLPDVNPAYYIGGVNPDGPLFSDCNAPSSSFTIQYNLDVSVCCWDYARDVRLGNLREQGIKEIWQAEDFRRLRYDLRRGIFNLPICKACAGLPGHREALREHVKDGKVHKALIMTDKP